MIVLVRHGQSVANAEGRLVGRLDSRLTDSGRAQAHHVAAVLFERSAETLAAVVSSPLSRAVDTAKIIADRLAVPLKVDERWIELDYGRLDGRRLQDVPRDLWVEWQSDDAYVPGGGESLATLGQRVKAACGEIQDRAEQVVVVSHVSPIKAAVAWALAVRDGVAWRMHLDPGSITEIRCAPGRPPALVRFNEVPGLLTPST